MKKTARLALAIVLLPYLVAIVQAGSNVLGNLVNVGQVGGTSVTTGAGASSAGTLRVILASDSPAGNVTNAGTFAVQNNAATPAGTNLIGKVGIDQTTPGTTNKVSIGTDGTVAINAAIPAGTNLIGKTGIDQTTDGTTNKVSAGQNGTWTVQPGNTANTTPWLVAAPAVSAPTIAKVGATTSSAQLIAASATRKGIEIDCDCENTDSVAINFGASAAVYATHKRLTPCANYQPPPGVTVTSAIQIISNSGTQNCRVIEYP